MTKNRIHFFDNLKGLLIFFVVIGHYALPIHNVSDSMNGVYEFIYMFHMPLFIFISGFFSKSIYKNGRLRTQKIISIIVLAALFQLLLTTIEKHDNFSINYLLNFSSAPWYLVSLGFYYLLVPFFSQIRPVAALVLSTMFSLGINCFDAAGNFLAISRTIVFLPFFLLGYYCTKEQILAIKESRVLVVPVVVSLFLLIVMVIHGGILGSGQYVLYGNSAFKGSSLEGMATRILIFGLAIFISLAIISLTPKRNTYLAIIGERTLQIYILHRLVRPLLESFGLFNLAIFLDPVWGVVIILAISAIITFLCSWSGFKKPFDFILSMQWNFLREPAK